MVALEKNKLNRYRYIFLQLEKIELERVLFVQSGKDLILTNYHVTN